MMSGWGRWPVHPSLQRLVAEGLDLAPREPGRAGAQDGSADGAVLIPRPCATSRWVHPRLHFCRRISRVWRMDSRSVAIPPPFGGGRSGRRSRRRYAAIALITILRSR
jgi:hypothetical protein